MSKDNRSSTESHESLLASIPSTPHLTMESREATSEAIFDRQNQDDQAKIKARIEANKEAYHRRYEALFAATPSTPPLTIEEDLTATSEAIRRRQADDINVEHGKRYEPLFAAIPSTPSLTVECGISTRHSMAARLMEDRAISTSINKRNSISNGDSAPRKLQSQSHEEPVQHPDFEAYQALHPRFPHLTQVCRADTVFESRSGKIPENIPLAVLTP